MLAKDIAAFLAYTIKLNEFHFPYFSRSLFGYDWLKVSIVGKWS